MQGLTPGSLLQLDTDHAVLQRPWPGTACSTGSFVVCMQTSRLCTCSADQIREPQTCTGLAAHAESWLTHLFVLPHRQRKLLFLRGTWRCGNAINVSVASKVPFVGDRQRVGVLSRDAGGCDAQDSPIFPSPRSLGAKKSCDAVGRGLPICSLPEMQQVIDSGHIAPVSQ